MTKRNYILLTTPTNRTTLGPKLHLVTDKLEIEYDFEMDDGKIIWSKIFFDDILAFDFRNSACDADFDFRNSACNGDSEIVSSKIICSYSESPYLEKILGAWRILVGWQDFEIKKNKKSPYLHFFIHFVDAGSLNVVARGCCVEKLENNSPS
jgi:hypothetical protein